VEINPVNVELTPGEAIRLGLTLVRTDGTVASAQATLLPGTRPQLPRATDMAPRSVT